MIKEFFKYYASGVFTLLGAIGYLAIPLGYIMAWPINPLGYLIVFLPWTFTLGALIALSQLGLALFYIYKKKKPRSTLHKKHLIGFSTALFGYILWIVGISKGLIITV